MSICTAIGWLARWPAADDTGRQEGPRRQSRRGRRAAIRPRRCGTPDPATGRHRDGCSTLRICGLNRGECRGPGCGRLIFRMQQGQHGHHRVVLRGAPGSAAGARCRASVSNASADVAEFHACEHDAAQRGYRQAGQCSSKFSGDGRSSGDSGKAHRILPRPGRRRNGSRGRTPSVMGIAAELTGPDADWCDIRSELNR